MNFAKTLILALVLVEFQAIAFQLPAIKADDGVSGENDINKKCIIWTLLTINEVKRMIRFIRRKEWILILPQVIVLTQDIRKTYKCFKDSIPNDFLQNLKPEVGTYLECLHDHFTKANEWGSIFASLLVSGDQEKGRKVLPKLYQELKKAAYCKKD